MEHTFTDTNFEDEVIKSPIPVMVDFWAPWCGPCRVVGPIVEDLAEEMDATRIKIGKLNVDENMTTAQQYNIFSIPTLLIFKDGKIADQMVGSLSKEAIKERLEKAVGSRM